MKDKTIKGSRDTRSLNLCEGRMYLAVAIVVLRKVAEKRGFTENKGKSESSWNLVLVTKPAFFSKLWNCKCSV